jgi:HPr kinase/phosphorylase
MQIHASCAARDGAGVLLLGPSGCGKSDMVLRLLDRGFRLVADDRVDIADGWASAPAALAGLLEVRGLGIVRLAHVSRARLALAVDLSRGADRLPRPERHERLDVPLIHLDPAASSAAQRIALALDCALGLIDPVVGAFGPREAAA